MAKQQFQPVFAADFVPPPQQAGVTFCPQPDGGVFQPWRRYEFTGRFEDETQYKLKHPDGDFDVPAMSPEQLEAYEYIRAFTRGHHIAEADLPDEAFEVEKKDPRRFRGRVLAITGAAGAGKSVLVKWVRETLGCSICATTGAAALLVGGTTIDLMFAFKRSTWMPTGSLHKSMTAADRTIVVDEASMIGSHMAEMIENALDMYHEKLLILVGDWAQAAPVKEDWPFGSALFRCAEVVNLTRCYRQSDREYLDALNVLRNGALSEYFERCVGPEPGLDDNVLCMYATNKEAADRNDIMFRRHVQRSGEKPVRMWATIQIAEAKQVFNAVPKDQMAAREKEGKVITFQNGSPGYEISVPTWRDGGIPDWKADKLYQDSKMAHDMELCVGARALITRNSRPTGDGERAYVNGDVGTIVALPQFVAKHAALSVPGYKDPVQEPDPESETQFLVKLDRNGQTVVIEPTRAEMFDSYVGSKPNPNVGVTGYPVQLGWAVTIHKSQGMTLPAAFVSLSSIRRMPTRHGLAYVALSRTRDSSTLRIDCADYGVAWRDAAVDGLV